MKLELAIIRLSAAAQATYEALVDQTGTTAAELRAALGLSDREIVEALAVLRKRDLITRIGDGYAVTAPDVALGALLLETEARLERARLHAARLAERHRRAVGDPVQPDLVEIVHGGEEITRRAEQMMRTARHEVCFIDKPPYAKLQTAISPVEADLLARGVRFRGLYDREALHLHDLRSDLEAGIALGEEARAVADAPTKLILVDDRIAIMPLRPAPSVIESAVVVHPSALLRALSALFHELWRSAFPLALPDGVAVTTDVLSKDDTRLLALLTTGMPDRSIAKQLGLSYRTFQRRLQNLMARLGASTRFQAGLRAAARGWVPMT